MNRKKHLLIILLSTIIIFSTMASAQKESNTNKKKKQITRIVSLAPNITEIIFALEKDNLLIGRTNFCNYPPQVAKITSVGEMMEPNIEKIVELKPDIVLASTHAQKEIAEKLNTLGIELEYLYYDNSLEGTFTAIETVGTILNAEKKASKIVKNMKERYKQVEIKTKKLSKKPSVYYVIGFGEGGEWTAGGNTFIGQTITAAGGNNIAGKIDGWSYSLEKIIQADPEIILISKDLHDGFIHTPPYSNLGAVKNKRVYTIDQDIINRPGPRLIEGVEILNDIFTKK